MTKREKLWIALAEKTLKDALGFINGSASDRSLAVSSVQVVINGLRDLRR